MQNIRNFSIIAHIDHGKSTLSDRLIQAMGWSPTGISRTRSWTTWISSGSAASPSKARRSACPTQPKTAGLYHLNLIDTPGHVDFTYEVSRALASCEGALLLIDASQGVEAQTLANLYLALEHDLEIIPVINKIDLPSADIERVKAADRRGPGARPGNGHSGFGQGRHRDRRTCSKPSSIGCRRRQGTPTRPCEALIFDSHYDAFRGTVVHFRDLRRARISPGDNIIFMSNGAEYRVEEVGIFQLRHESPESRCQAGQVGYIIAGIKTVSDTRCGDTITLKNIALPQADARVQGSQAGGVFLHLSGGLGRLRRSGRRPWKSSSSTMPP